MRKGLVGHWSFFFFLSFFLVSHNLCIAFAVMAFTVGYGDVFLEYLLHVRMACGKGFQKQIERKGTGPVFGMAGMDTSAFYSYYTLEKESHKFF